MLRLLPGHPTQSDKREKHHRRTLFSLHISHQAQETRSPQQLFQRPGVPRANGIESEVKQFDVAKRRRKDSPVLPILPEEGVAYHRRVG